MKEFRDKQLRHRIFQASFRGIQRAIERKLESTVSGGLCRFKEHFKSMLSTWCSYSLQQQLKGWRMLQWGRAVARRRGSTLEPSHKSLRRWGRCSEPGWAVHKWEAHSVHPTAAHEPIGIPKSLWARWKPHRRCKSAVLSK